MADARAAAEMQNFLEVRAWRHARMVLPRTTATSALPSRFKRRRPRCAARYAQQRALHPRCGAAQHLRRARPRSGCNPMQGRGALRCAQRAAAAAPRAAASC
jgi:hypothetical protein